MQQSFLESLRCALKGVSLAWRGERNFRIEIAIGILAVSAGWYFSFTTTEWLILILVMGMVLAVETLNTSFEELCDKFAPEHDPRIEKIKDLAAAAVFLTSLTALAVGSIIFMPYVIALW